mgnify:FL=1
MFKMIICYEGYEKYLMTSERFTLEQRYLCTIRRYFEEVIHGRYHQFFYNSTGIVWEDALNGFKHFGIPEFADNFQKVIDCYGGTISFDREERWNMLESLEEKNEEEFSGILDEVVNFTFEKKTNLIISKLNLKSLYLSENIRGLNFKGENYGTRYGTQSGFKSFNWRI